VSPAPEGGRIEPDRLEAELREASLPGVPHRGTVLPNHAGLSIAAIPDLIQSAFRSDISAPPRLAAAWPPDRVDATGKILLLILDGLGYLRLRELLETVPDLYLGELAERGQLLPLTSVCPSTTVSAMATLSTAASPQEHGLLGYRLYLREIGAVTNMIRLAVHGNPKADTAITLGIEPEGFLGTTTVFERLTDMDVSCDVLLSRQIAGSGLSKLLYRGATKVHGITTFSDAVVSALERLRREGRQFVTLYWGSLDGVGHVYGPHSSRFVAELRALDACLRQQIEGSRLDATLLVVADHGMVEMAPADYLEVAALSELDAALRLPLVGEPRATYCHLAEREVERIQQAIASREEYGFAVLRSEEALERGLFGVGASHPEAARRVGDLMLLSTGRHGLYHAYPDAPRLRGMHGGLTDQEMLVPLLLVNI